MFVVVCYLNDKDYIYGICLIYKIIIYKMDFLFEIKNINIKI